MPSPGPVSPTIHVPPVAQVGATVVVVVGAIAEGTITTREGQQIRAQYGAKLSMIDHWFGKVLDALDRTNAWQDTAVVLCTDHGYYLGESDASSLDLWGKPAIPVYKTLATSRCASPGPVFRRARAEFEPAH